MLFNGWKQIHCLKYHLLLTPDGIMIHIYGPVEGRQHDETVYKESSLEDILKAHFHTPEEAELFIFGDSGYSCHGHILTPYKDPQTEAQHSWNSQMSKVHEPVDQNAKVLLQPCGLYYLVAILLCNAHTILHYSQTLQYFNCAPPSLEEYFYGGPVADDELDSWCMSSPWKEVDVPADKIDNEDDNI
ncbi:hypothetical protein Hypma_000158 [Hypsizygus marmoreus]|uniref:DDE Tnp4 domain-containing protein n=1 Tax=Hypsizygus marmoreus TaxID=39966 RepID=A0A369K8R1_HYPMA|nr:hypothetical protein Hypma_000158 [Hypsizygus marmoreus]